MAKCPHPSPTGRGVRASWLSLDSSDNDPARFLRYFLAAFQKADSSLGANSQSLLEMPQFPPVNALLDDLLNDLAALDTPFVLILDDYHVITNPEIHAALEYFLEHQPASIHLVLTTRADPPLPLARLRARRQMTEILARNLRFTPDEARAFFGLANLLLAENALRALDERTEGWAAGLQLAALALQHQPDPAAFIETFRGSHRYVLDYLAGEVIQPQGEEMRAFLTQTSILNRFNADLCNALTGRDDSQALIARLEQWLIIRGYDVNKPVLLFLSDGPGASEAARVLRFNAELEKHFVVVIWEQRGCGKSYPSIHPKSDLTVDQYVDDLIELTDILRERFDKQKIVSSQNFGEEDIQSR